MRAISLFSRELGISALSCSARFALRILVSMSAIGSVCNATRPYFHNWSSDVLSPTAFRHSGDHSLVREVAQADPAEPELLVDRARAAAAVAARVRARLEPLRLARLLDQCFACHQCSLQGCCSVSRSLARSQSPHATAAQAGCLHKCGGGLWRRAIAGERRADIGRSTTPALLRCLAGTASRGRAGARGPPRRSQRWW